MDAYELEVGLIQRTFDNHFKLIGEYFQSSPVVPDGLITETDLSHHSQKQLRKTLNASLKHYGFADLPISMRIIAQRDSHISGIHRSDNITVYEEKMKDGSHRTFNFYSTFGPENMKASYYWLDKRNGGEQTQGMLTNEDIWYLRVLTHGGVFYQRIEKDRNYL